MELACVDEGLDPLAGVEGEQVDDGRAPRGPLLQRHLVRSQPVDPSQIGKKEQVGVGGRIDDLRHDVGLAQVCAPHAACPPALGPVSRGRDRLYVARPAHGDHELAVLNEVFGRHFARVDDDLRQAGRSKTLFDLGQLGLDHAVHEDLVAQ